MRRRKYFRDVRDTLLRWHTERLKEADVELELTDARMSHDAQNDEYGNLVTKGIIDPTKVVRAAIQNAASVAGLLITTEAMVAELPKKESPAMPGGGGMGGMGGMDY